MEQTNMQQKQILGDLYALRAGISVVSQIKDEADGVVRKCEAECELIYNKNDSEIIKLCDSLNKGTIVQKGEWLVSSDFTKDCCNKINYLKYDIRQNRKKLFFRGILAILLLAVALCALFHFSMVILSKDLIGLIDIEYTELLREKLGRAMQIILIILWWLSLPITIVGLIFFAHICVDIKNYKRGIKCIKKQISAIKRGMNTSGINGQQIIANIETGKKEANIIIRNGKQVYGALCKIFSCFVDERDWKYLDLLIYYFETGRAGTLQEALQQVDREIQTQRIIESIKYAEQHICNAISNAASRIERSLDQVSAQLDAVISGQSAQLTASRELVGTMNLSTALQSKMNATSEQLMNDVHNIYRYKL